MVHKALETNELRTLNAKDRTFKVSIRDSSDRVSSNTWKPLFMKMGNH